MTTETKEIQQLEKEITLLKGDLQNVTNQLTKSLIESEISRIEKCIRVAIKQNLLYVDVLLKNGTKYDKCSLHVDSKSECISDGTEAKVILRDLTSIYVKEKSQKYKNKYFSGIVKTEDIQHYALYHGLA